MHLLDFTRRFLRDDEGQDLIEYMLLATLIAIAVIAAVTNAGTATVAIFDNVATKLAAAL